MLTRAQTWAWYFDRNPDIATSWAHQNGLWPEHSASCQVNLQWHPEWRHPESCDCWCHTETVEAGGSDGDCPA